jgi:DNA helicase-2/ATP-dependent DNA helicase PcrA
VSREHEPQPVDGPKHPRIDYARDLNAQQLAAVTAPPGPALVIAGAGSGKTRTLIYRVAYLLEQGVPPQNILLLTFTNKAAHEMMRRVEDLLGSDVAALWGGTFHAVGNRVLRIHAERLGYPRDFTILDREDAEELVSACLREAAGEPKDSSLPKTEVLAETFSLAANTRETIPRFLERRHPAFAPLGAKIEAVQQAYAARKRGAGVLDFDDLLVLWLRLLEEQAGVRDHYQRRFQFVLVDEYQDTNQLQSDLVELLAARHGNVMAVGDDAQSIYSWRGANFRNILDFPDRHPNAQVFRIETNYRSTPEILAVANAAIAPNVHQHPKVLTSARRPGDRPRVVVCGDTRVQAAFVAHRALELCEDGVDLSRMAVLYRSHFHAFDLQLELTRRQIPFTITSGLRFFEQAHIKDVAAYLRLLVNPRDEMAFKRLVKMLKGIGTKGADRLWLAFLRVFEASAPTAAEPGPEAAAPETGPLTPETDTQDPDWSVGETLAGGNRTHGDGSAAAPQPALAPALAAIAHLAPKKAAADWEQLTHTLAQLQPEPLRQREEGGGQECPRSEGAQLQTEPFRQSVASMIRLILEARYRDYLEETYANYRARLEDLEQLTLFAQEFSWLEDFLSQLALLSNLEAEAQAQPADDADRLRLSTIHQAKGLEFDVVFVIMLSEGAFPSRWSAESEGGLEEERRLFYVAITRARDQLYLTYPLLRPSRDGGAPLQQPRSPFLRDIPTALVEERSLGFGLGGPRFA